MHWQVYAILSHNSVPMIHSIGSLNLQCFGCLLLALPCLLQMGFIAALCKNKGHDQNSMKLNMHAVIQDFNTSECTLKVMRGLIFHTLTQSVCPTRYFVVVFFFFSMVAFKLISPGNQNTWNAFIIFFFQKHIPQISVSEHYLVSPREKKRRGQKKNREQPLKWRITVPFQPFSSILINKS